MFWIYSKFNLRRHPIFWIAYLIRYDSAVQPEVYLVIINLGSICVILFK